MKTIAALILLPPLTAIAEPAPSPPSKSVPKAWSGEVDFGLIRATGNTQSDSFNGKARVKYRQAKWTHTASLIVLNATSNGTTTAQSYTFNGKTRHDYQKREYRFANLLYQDDHLSGYRTQVSGTIGYGQRVVDEPRVFLDLELGGGVRQSQPRFGQGINEAIGRAFGNLEWKVGMNSLFSQHLTMESGRANTQIQSVTALKSKINGNLAMEVSYTVKHNTLVPAGSVKTETITNVALVVDF